jgi:hypothetical protein
VEGWKVVEAVLVVACMSCRGRPSEPSPIVTVELSLTLYPIQRKGQVLQGNNILNQKPSGLLASRLEH